MTKYNPEALYSFRHPIYIRKELIMKRVYFRHGKKVVETFYAERTDIPNIIYVPDIILCNERNRTIHGAEADIKNGDYFLGKEQVILHTAHQVHNRAGYVYIENID